MIPSCTWLAQVAVWEPLDHIYSHVSKIVEQVLAIITDTPPRVVVSCSDLACVGCPNTTHTANDLDILPFLTRPVYSFTVRFLITSLPNCPGVTFKDISCICVSPFLSSIS